MWLTKQEKWCKMDMGGEMWINVGISHPNSGQLKKQTQERQCLSENIITQ